MTTSAPSTEADQPGPGDAGRIVVMTGATAGIGEAAARKIAEVSGARIITGARSARAGDADQLGLDLSSLESVRQFAARVVDRLGGSKIDVLVLNAGMNFAPAGATSVDGYELTFAVNHLSHYLLLRLLDPDLADRAHVIVTTSDAHDPARNSLGPPVHADIAMLVDPSLDADRPRGAFKQAMYAYSASKLCNLLTARMFAERPGTRQRGITVIAYNPGLTLGTRLGRTMPKWQLILTRALGLILKPMLGLPTVDLAGGTLAELALGLCKPPRDHSYASLVRGRLTWPAPSELAQSEEAAERVWRESAKLVGLGTDDHDQDPSRAGIGAVEAL